MQTTGSDGKSTDSGCNLALQAVSTYGPTLLGDMTASREAEEKVEIRLIVLALDTAADVAGDPTVKQSINNLANDYTKFRSELTDATLPPKQAILADTSHLKSLCGS
jgi:hypothetical protein